MHYLRGDTGFLLPDYDSMACCLEDHDDNDRHQEKEDDQAESVVRSCLERIELLSELMDLFV